MTISEIQLFQILKKKLGDKAAEERVSFVRPDIKTEFDTRKEMYATKNDIVIVREDMISIKSDLSKSIYRWAYSVHSHYRFYNSDHQFYHKIIIYSIISPLFQ